MNRGELMRGINSLDGIKAIACIGIVISQFKNVFFPEYDSWILETPFRILMSDDTMVRVLFVLCGIVVSFKYFTKEDTREAPKEILLFWFRLVPVLVFVNLIVYIMMKLELLCNLEEGKASDYGAFFSLFNTFEPDLGICIKEAFLTCFTQGSNLYVEPLWAIHYIFWGGILVLVAICLSQNYNSLKWIFYAVAIFGFSNYYNYFVMGMLVCDLYCNSNFLKKIGEKRVLNGMLFLVAFYAVCMVDIVDSVKSTRIMWGIAAIAMFITFLNATWSQRLFDNKFFKHLGSLSFCIYVVYWPIMQSFSSRIFLWLYGEKNLSSIWSFRINLLLSLGVIIIVAHIIHKYIETIGMQIISLLEDKKNVGTENSE